MVMYTVIMFVVALLMLVFGILIFRGNTDLIHSYHRENVEDFENYGRGMGKALVLMGLSMTTSGIVAFFTDFDKPINTAVIVLLAGLALSFVYLFKVQKKHNGGIF